MTKRTINLQVAVNIYLQFCHSRSVRECAWSSVAGWCTHIFAPPLWKEGLCTYQRPARGSQGNPRAY